MIEAMKLALEALENNPYALAYSKVITSLRQAIEQAEKQRHEFVCGECVKCGASIEKQEPVAWMYEVNGAHTILDLFEPPDDAYDEGTLYPLYTTPQPQRDTWKNAAIRLGEELSSFGPDGYYDMTAEQWLSWALDQQPNGKHSLPQPKREFVGLTEEEVNELEEDQTLETTHDFISAIEAKLKEKNGL